MGDLKKIREGLVSNLGSISGLQPKTRFSQITSGLALVGLPTRIIYDESTGGDTYTIPVKVFMANSEANREAFVEFMNEAGSTSVRQALESDPDLGGACDSLRVTEMEMAAPEYENEKATYLTADWSVEVFA